MLCGYFGDNTNLLQTADNDESFEDAVDAVSVRSLTKRSVSTSKPPPKNEDQQVPSLQSLHDDIKEPDAESNVESASKSGRDPSPLSRRLSTTSNLDNVNLDDEALPANQGTNSSTSKIGVQYG